MADDVKDDQVGSNFGKSNQTKNSKNKKNITEKTRASKRIKGDQTNKISDKSDHQTKRELASSSSNPELTHNTSKNIVKHKPKQKIDKNKNIQTENETDVPGPSGIRKQKKIHSKQATISLKKYRFTREKAETFITENSSNSESQSVSDLSTIEVTYPFKSKSDSSLITPKKSQKRKSREIPLYSPKVLRSSTRSARNPATGKTVKTGGRLSQARNPSQVGEVGESTGNLGSCASNRTESSDNQNASAGIGGVEQSNTDGPSVVAVASLANSGGSSSSQDGESPLGLEEGDMSRLQALLEARGLPAHLFGSLGPRMHLLLHKTFNTGAGTKAQQLMLSMQNEEEGTQLQGVMEMCQLLVMGNEETLSGFPVKQVVPVLIKLLQMEHNFDIMNHACRSLTYLMEALPRSSVVVIDAVPMLLEKLQTIQCMDVAEQSLTALEMLSKRHGKNILQCGGLGASLLFLDFFSIVAQRSALAITANCCHSVSCEDFHFVRDSIPILSNRLNNQDKKSLESVCSAFARIVDSVQKEKKILEELCEHGLLANLKQLLVISPPIISSGTFVMVIRMLAVMCAKCPSIAVKLVKLNVVETIKYLLIGSNNVPTDDIVELVPRSPQELYELICLISELLPNLPATGIFSIDAQLGKGLANSYQSGTWQWRDDRNTWHTYLWVDNRIIEAAYQSGEDEISLSTLGRNYIIDFTSMQQINEDTGTIRAIQRKSGSGQTTTATNKSNEKVVDERKFTFDSESELGANVVQSLIAVIYDVYYSSVGPAVKHKCLCSMLKMLYHSPAELLKDILPKIPISSYIAGMLSSQDLRIVCSALQIADILMSKLPDSFHVHFRREGVMHKIKGLADGDITVSPADSPEKGTKTGKQKRSAGNSSSVQNSNADDSARTFDDIDYFTETTADSSCVPSSSSSSSRLTTSKSKKRNIKKFGRQRHSKSSLNEETPSVPLSKKVSHELLRPKSATFTSSSSALESTSHKGSFFSNFAPRWGRSQSYQNTTPGQTISSEKSLKERFVKEQEKNKEQIRSWIKNTAQSFYDKYFADEAGFTHSALSILQRLTTASEGLSLNNESDEALESISDVLLNEDADAGPSPFEIVHSGMVNKLLKYLTWEGSGNESTCSKRIKIFLKIFLGISNTSDNIASSTLKPSPKSAFGPLVQKLNLCINQLEQFPVKCQDIPGASMTSAGSRGSSVLRFFNTHQIKCNLVRHPDCTNLKQWSGGAVKIDPLALVQAIERYLVVRGYGKIREGSDFEMSDDDERSDDDIEESLATQIQGSSNPKHLLEFMLNGHVLPYNMTVYEAIRQYAQGNYDEENEIDEDSGPYGRASIWSGTHTLHFRPISELDENVHTIGRRTKSETNTSKSSIKKKNVHPDNSKPNDSSTYLTDRLPGNWYLGDPSVEVICLARVLYYLNSHWEKYFDLQSSCSVISNLEFINTKLTAKATRQLQDPLVIMTGNLPSWLEDLAQACPFIFPFECRQLLFYTTTFDRDRAMMKLQDSVPDLATTDSSDRVMPRLDKKKKTVFRNDIFKQAESVLNEFLNTKSLLEIQYEGEVGTGLGPTLEFYTLVSREFQKSDLGMWRGDNVEICEGEGDSQKKLKYTYSRDGLFPAAIPKNTKGSQLAKIKSKFRYLGKFVGKACMDSRMVDLPFSQTLYKWVLGQGENIDLCDMKYVDSTLHNSLKQLYDVVLQKKKIENDDTLSPESITLALNSLTLDGVPIEDLGLDFILPGTSIELKKNGKDAQVTIENLEEYLQSVVQFSLHDGVSRQFQAFKEGFENFFPLQSLKMFYPHEMELLLCGCKSEQWDIKDLIECCRPDHGYTNDSRAVKFLFEILSKYDSNEQRMFLQFITGSPKLPVGGLKRLNPALTIVRKTIEGALNPDTYLPSVMTCVNYLKLPDYSDLDIMSERLRTAYQEGKNAFHLS